MAAARERFLEDGYLNATVPEIAVTAQRSPASFYTYFESKADLLRILAHEAIDDLESRLAADVGDVGVPVPELVHRVSATVWNTYRDELAFLLSIFQTAMRDLELDPWIRLRTVLVNAIEQVSVRAHAAGQEPIPNASAAARSIASMLEYSCFLWLREPNEPPERPLTDREAIDVLAKIWLASLDAPN